MFDGDSESSILSKRGYWRGFMCQNKNEIVSQKCRKFVSERSEWMSHEKFYITYDLVCDAIEKTGVTSKKELDLPSEKG